MQPEYKTPRKDPNHDLKSRGFQAQKSVHSPGRAVERSSARGRAVGLQHLQGRVHLQLRELLGHRRQAQPGQTRLTHLTDGCRLAVDSLTHRTDGKQRRPQKAAVCVVAEVSPLEVSFFFWFVGPPGSRGFLSVALRSLKGGAVSPHVPRTGAACL